MELGANANWDLERADTSSMDTFGLNRSQYSEVVVGQILGTLIQGILGGVATKPEIKEGVKEWIKDQQSNSPQESKIQTPDPPKQAKFSAELTTGIEALTLERLCFHGTGIRYFFRSLKALAVKTKDPDRVFKVWLSYLKSPEGGEPEYVVKQGPYTTMMDPMTYLSMVNPVLPRHDYEPRVIKTSRLLTQGNSAKGCSGEVTIVNSPALQARKWRSLRSWREQLASKAGEEIFVDREAIGEIQLKPEKQLAMLKILRPPQLHYVPHLSPVDYPLRTTCYSFQNVGVLSKRYLSLYDVWPYEKEKQFIPAGWCMDRERLWLRSPAPDYGLPEVVGVKMRLPEK